MNWIRNLEIFPSVVQWYGVSLLVANPYAQWLWVSRFGRKVWNHEKVSLQNIWSYDINNYQQLGNTVLYTYNQKIENNREQHDCNDKALHVSILREIENVKISFVVKKMCNNEQNSYILNFFFKAAHNNLPPPLIDVTEHRVYWGEIQTERPRRLPLFLCLPCYVYLSVLFGKQERIQPEQIHSLGVSLILHLFS